MPVGRIGVLAIEVPKTTKSKLANTVLLGCALPTYSGSPAATVLRMRVDQLLLTLHILAAATWIGAALALQVIAGHMCSPTPEAVTDRFAIDAETIGKTLFRPGA